MVCAFGLLEVARSTADHQIRFLRDAFSGLGGSNSCRFGAKGSAGENGQSGSPDLGRPDVAG
jgi:hypothetical protein